MASPSPSFRTPAPRSVAFGAGGLAIVPQDSGYGGLGRPTAVSEAGGRQGRIGTLETLFDFYIDNVADPDYALGQNIHADEIIRQQPDVAAAMGLRELTVASMPAAIEPAKGARLDMTMARTIGDYVQDVWSRLPNTSDLYRGMQQAVLQGGTGFEIIWDVQNGFEVPINYFNIHKTRFTFDRKGRMALLMRTAPTWGSYIADPIAGVPATQPSVNGFKPFYPNIPGKFIYHKNMSEGGSWHRQATEGFNYWGRGLNNVLWNLVQFDAFVTRFRVKFLERFGYPMTVLYYPDGDDNAGAQIRSIANQVRKEVFATIPRRGGENVDGLYKLEHIQPNMSGQDYFEKFQETFIRTKIEKIILGGANLMQLGSSGSYGASVDQRDSGSEIIFRYDAKNIDETLNCQLIPHIVWARWPTCPVEYMPKHVMAPKQAPDRGADVEMLEALARSVPVAQADFYRAAGVDRPRNDTQPQDLVYTGQSPYMVGGMDHYPDAYNQPGGDAEDAGDEGGKKFGKKGRKPIGQDKPLQGQGVKAAIPDGAEEDEK